MVTDAKVTITNSTIADNSTASNGGGILVFLGATSLTLINDTIADNTASSGGGGINVQAGTVTIENTIISGNVGSAAAPDDLNVVSASTFTINASNSLITTGAGNINGTNTSNITGVAAGLGTLKNNGGLTETLALQAGSRAIDTGSNSFAQGRFDERGAGFNRIINGVIDIGAYEYQPPAVQVSITSNIYPAQVGQTVIFTATVAGVAPGSNVPQGTVTFYIDGKAMATVTLVDGTASFGIATLSVGYHDAQAIYAPEIQGDYGFRAGQSSGYIQKVIASTSFYIPPTPVGRRWYQAPAPTPPKPPTPVEATPVVTLNTGRIIARRWVR